MGKILSKEGDFLKERGYKLVEEFEHPEYGLMTRLVQKFDNRAVFMKQFSLRDDVLHSTTQASLSRYKDKINDLHPSILKICGFVYDEDNLGCGVLPNIRIFFEPFHSSLEEEIVKR